MPRPSAATRIAWSGRRYFTERTFEDAKTEIGWDEFQAQKYRAWEHHLALTAAALWFVAQTKWAWAQMYTRDPALAYQLEVEVLPALSTANDPPQAAAKPQAASELQAASGPQASPGGEERVS